VGVTGLREPKKERGKEKKRREEKKGERVWR
jgi:hypothetical protein